MTADKSMAEDITDLLVELGLMAAGYRLRAEADAIADGVQALHADSARPGLIRAVSRLSGGDAAGAIQELGQVPDSARKDAMVKAFLALAYRVDGRSADCERTTEEVLQQGGEGAAVALARSLNKP